MSADMLASVLARELLSNDESQRALIDKVWEQWSEEERKLVSDAVRQEVMQSMKRLVEHKFGTMQKALISQRIAKICEEIVMEEPFGSTLRMAIKETIEAEKSRLPEKVKNLVDSITGKAIRAFTKELLQEIEDYKFRRIVERIADAVTDE